MSTTFSLQALPEVERENALQAAFSGYAVPIRTQLSSKGSIEANFVAHTVGRVTLDRFDVRGVMGSASRAASSADSAVEPALTLHAIDRGRVDIDHADRRQAARAGTIVVSTTGSALGMALRTRMAMSTITVPLARTELSPDLVRSSLNRPFAASDPVASTAFSMLRRLTDDVTKDPSLGWEALEDTLLALTRALITLRAGAAREADRPLAATLTDRVLHHIEEHALDPSCDAASIAAAHGISIRYLYVILRSRDVVLGERLRSLRLDAAAALLRDRSYSGSSIAGVAYRVGFADQAHFARAFRQRYEMTPRDWRRAGTEAADHP